MKSRERETGAPQGMRSFLIVWFGQVISLIGSGLTSFALGVWLSQQTGRATPFAITVLLANLPRILLAPLAGSLADRWNRRWMMVLSDSGDALVKLGAVVLVATGHLQIWHVYLIAVLSSVFAAFQEPAYAASITMLVPKKDLARANGLVQTAQAVESLLAPLLAGALMGTVGLRAIFAIDFITYSFAIGALLVVRIPQPKLSESDTGGDRGTVWRDARFGWSYLKARPGLLGLLLYFALVNFLLNGVGVLTAPMVLAFGSATTLGVVQMASGAGMLLGSVVMSTWGGPQRRIVGVIGAIALAALGGLAMGLRPWAPLVSCGLAWFLFWIPVAAGSSQAIFQSKVARGAQGRVFAVRSMLARSMMPLATLVAGPLADYVFDPLMAADGSLGRTWVGQVVGTGPGRGIGLMYIVSALLLIVVSALAWTNPRIRMVEEQLPDAMPA
ncbi:MAG: MFS transporter [Anaerolineae bacterium]|nr:MFS transporter [Anaerolineae bacterium]